MGGRVLPRLHLFVGERTQTSVQNCTSPVKERKLRKPMLIQSNSQDKVKVGCVEKLPGEITKMLLAIFLDALRAFSGGSVKFPRSHQTDEGSAAVSLDDFCRYSGNSMCE